MAKCLECFKPLPKDHSDFCSPGCEDKYNEIWPGDSRDPDDYYDDYDNGPTGHGDMCWSDADPGL